MKRMIFIKKPLATDIYIELTAQGLPTPKGILETPSGEVTLQFDDKVTDAQLDSIKTALQPILSGRIFKKIVTELDENK